MSSHLTRLSIDPLTLQTHTVTEHQDHAKNYVMQTLDLDGEAYDGIVTCGGDGIFSEVINVSGEDKSWQASTSL